jgi:CspA family cold shock protein
MPNFDMSGVAAFGTDSRRSTLMLTAFCHGVATGLSRESRLLGRSVFRGDPEVAMGTVKWFNATKGYGFIKPDSGGQDVFVHISAVEKAGHASLAEGSKISYELVAGRSGKVSAEHLRVG